MKQISKKSKILVAALIAFMVVICGAVTFTPTELQSQEAPNVSTSWYQFEHGTDSITIRLNDDIRSLREAKKEDISKLKNELTSALKTMFMDEILNSTPETPEGNGIMRTALDLPDDFDPETFWDDVEGNPKKFKDYIVNRLSDPDELKSFSEGAYDMLLEQAIGEYISGKKNEGIEDIEQEYNKIQEAIDKVVDQAAEKAVEKQIEKEAERELAQQFAKEYVKDHPGETPSPEATQKYVEEQKSSYLQSHKEDLQQKAQETIKEYTEEIKKEDGGVVANAVQKVEENGGAAPSITVQDMLEALKSVSIDGVLLYDKENKDDTIRNEGISKLMSKLPRPAAVANMGQEDIKNLFKADLLLGTTYGDIKIDFTFGFYGTTRNVQRMAKAIADHVEVVRDGSDLTVNLTMPELVSKFFRSLYNAGGINYESKKAIFDFFDSSVADFADGKAYSFEELITLLKDINYQKLFENLLSASALNNYFGSYLTEMFGRTITDKDIERAINSLRNYALKVEKWDTDTVADFLYNIPGFKKLADSVESGKLNSVVEKFLEMVQKINWENYSAQQIIEILKGDTINQKVLNNLDTYSDTYSGIYNKLLSSLSEMCDLLPENFATDKLYDFYKENGKLNYEGKLTLDFGEIIGKISDIIGGNSEGESEGESETESFLGNLKTALSSKKFEYNLKLNVTTPDINKVQFVYDFEGDGNYEVLDEGLLPTNTNIKSLAPQTITFRDGTSAEVGHWVEVDAEVDKNNPEKSAVTKMPDRDIKLRAVFDLDEEIDIEVVNPHVVPTIKGYSPTANRRVEYTYMGGERSVRWEYELKAVSKTEKNYPSEVLKTWLSATIGGEMSATNVGNYTSTLKLMVDPESENAKYISLKDKKSEYTYEDTWTIEKANVKVEGIKLGSEEEENVLEGDDVYALFIQDIEGGTHTVKWQFTLSVTNDYGNYWTDEKIREYLDIVEGGDITSSNADVDLTATLKIDVKEANKGNFSMVAVDETAKWMIKCEDFIPKTEIDLTGAKWMLDGKEYTTDTKVEADGKQKALTVSSTDENVAKYFADGVLKVVYVDAQGNESENAPTAVGTYTVKVVLVDTTRYTLKNIADTTLNIIEKVLPRQEVKIDLTGAKWMRNGQEHKDDEKIITDGTSDVKLTVETNDTNKQYFTDGILQIVYYYKSGMKLSSGAPSKVGDYIARVVLVKSEVEKDGKIYVYSIDKNIDDALMQLRTETTVAPAETVNIDLGNGEWTLNGEKLDSTTELVEDGTFKFLKVSGLDEATARLFTKGVLTIAYYKDGEDEKMTHAPIDAGKYTAKVELRVTEGYNIVENIDDAKFEIKARPSLPDDEVIDLSEAKWQYEGEEYDPTKTIEKTGEAVELKVVGIDETYFTNNIIEIVYYNGEGKMDSAPVEAGIYFVRVGLKAESGYKLGSSMETIIIITEKKAEPKQIDVSSVKWTLGEEKVEETITVKADGTRKELSISGLDDEYIENGIVEIVYYDEDGHRLLAAPKTAGTYTAKLEVRGDGYILSDEVEVTIIIEDDTTVAPAEPVEIDLSKAKWVYRGAEVTETTTIYFDGTAKNLEIEAGVIIAGYFVRDILAIEYYEGEDKLDGAPTEVGEYTAKVVLKDTKNYKLTGEIEDLSFEIVEDPSYIEPGTKIAIDLTGAKWMFGDSEVTDRVEIESDGRAKALTVSSSDAKITEYFANGILRVVYVDKDNHESEIAPSLVGTYTVKVIVSDADRYELTNIANVTLVITEAAVQPVAKIEIALTGAKWFMGDAEFDFAEIEEDGLSKALTVGGISADLQRYFTSGVLVINYYDAEGNKLFGAPKDAGVYTVKVELADANKYELKENIANATLTISEKDGNGHWWLIILTICIALVVIVAIVLVELLVISKKKKQDKPQGENQPQDK